MHITTTQVSFGPQQASPADLRSNLDPAEVDALADQFHVLFCVNIAGQQPPWPKSHRDLDRSKARFVLMGLRDAGWRLTADGA
jgi:hypothetical protein